MARAPASRYLAAAARVVGQAALYGLFALVVGYFSSSPAYVHFDPGKALIKLSLGHTGERKGKCRERAVPANVPSTETSRRALLDCPRERLPVLVEVEVDGALRYRGEKAPAGLFASGESRFYERIPVAAGRHRIVARMRDSARPEGFDYAGETEVTLAPRQVFVIDFRAESSSFVFR